MHRVLSVDELLDGLPPPMGIEQVPERLRVLLSRAWSKSWYKAVNKNRRRHPVKEKELGAHNSVYRVLAAAQSAKSDRPKPSVKPKPSVLSG